MTLILFSAGSEPENLLVGLFDRNHLDRRTPNRSNRTPQRNYLKEISGQGEELPGPFSCLY